MTEIAARLEELRTAIHAECISYGELAELADLAEHIQPGDVELLEWAGVPEYPEGSSSPLRLDLTPTQIRAILDVIGPVVADTTGPLEEAERELDSALLRYETEEATS